MLKLKSKKIIKIEFDMNKKEIEFRYSFLN